MASGGSGPVVPAPRAIRDVVFDLGGVLIDWDPRYLFRDHLGGNPAEVDAFLADVCTPIWHARLDGGASFAAETRALAARFPQHARWIEAYGSNWHRMFAGSFAESVTCLERLAGRGYRLHALSNYPAEHIRFLYRRFPFMRRFETVVLSGLLRCSKPDPAIYAYVLARIGGRPCLFVDDRAENVSAAIGAGMQAMLFEQASGVEQLWARLGESAAPAVEIDGSFA